MWAYASIEGLPGKSTSSRKGKKLVYKDYLVYKESSDNTGKQIPNLRNYHKTLYELVCHTIHGKLSVTVTWVGLYFKASKI